MNLFPIFYIYLFFTPIYCFPPSLPTPSWKELRLKWIRKKIDVVDDGIYHLIQKRLELSKNLQGLKPQIRDPIREVVIVSRLQKKRKLDSNFVKNVWILFFQQSYLVQEESNDKEDHFGL